MTDLAQPVRPRLLRAKQAAAWAGCQPWVGDIFARLLNNRIPHRGCTIDTSSKAVSASVKARLLWGLYESAETRFVKQYLRDDLDVIELGSSLGVVASHIAKKLRADGRLICVEANDRLLESIARNVKANTTGAKLTLVHAAAYYGDEDAQVIGFHRDADSTASAIASPGGQALDLVPALTLEALLGRFGVEDYALVCDIEGAEAGLIAREAAGLARCQQIIIELHDAVWNGLAVTVEEMCGKLRDTHGFILRDRYGPVCVFERPSSAK